MTQTAPEPFRLPWGTTPEGEFTRGGTVVASVMGTLAVFVTFPLGLAGVLLSCAGLDRVRRHEASGRKLLLWSWILFVPGTVVGVPLAIFALAGLVSSILS
jgi:hypothetical protein